MKLFLYEHITSGALCGHPLPPGLAREGELMLQAALQDALACDDLHVITLRDARFSTHAPNTALHTYIISNPSQFYLAWQQALKQADAALIIAPENDNLLANLNQQVLDHGKRLLGCQPNAVKLSSDKQRCGQQLNAHGIQTPASAIAAQWHENSFNAPHGFLIKPNQSAGCESTYHFPDKASTLAWQNTQTPDTLKQTLIQEYIPGTSISLTVLCNETHAHVFAINQQHITQQNHTLHFTGCTVNGLKQSLLSRDQAKQIAHTIHTAISGLWGWTGIDLILTENAPVIVDINPRLTTPYAGLATSLAINPMQLLINLETTKKLDFNSNVQQNAIKITI